MNIYEKMSAVTEDIKKVPKNLSIGYGKYQYKAVAEADILAAVKEAEKKHGIYSYPAESAVIESRVVVNEKAGEKRENQFVRIERTYRFVNIETPEEFVEVKGYGDGYDSLDKAPGKAITYADKYALMKAYKIETGDDLDARPSDDLMGHDAFKIKQRIEKILTEKLQGGKTIGDVCTAMGITKKQCDAVMNYPAQLITFEAKLKSI